MTKDARQPPARPDANDQERRNGERRNGPRAQADPKDTRSGRRITDVADKDGFVPVSYVYERWHCDDRLVRKLLRERQLEYYRLGGEIRIKARDIIAYETKNRIGTDDT